MTDKIIIPKEKLNELYIINGLSTYKIAELFKCNPSVIQKRLREYGIEIRKPKEKIEISRSLLKRLYVDEGLSTYKIAKKLRIGRTTIYNRIILLNIKTRPKKIVKIPKKRLIELYKIRKLSLSEIGVKYNCTPAAILKKFKIYKIERRDRFEANVKYPKKKFDGDNITKAYMIGFRLGDLNVTRFPKDSHVIRINTSTTKKEQVELIRKVFGKFGHFHCKWIVNSYNMTFNLDKSFEFLLEKKDEIKDWILNNNKYFITFLAGYTDAEGNIGIYDKKARYRVGSYDKGILHSVYRKLKEMGMDVKMRLETPKGRHGKIFHHNDFWRVSVNRKNDLLKLLELLKPYIKHEKRHRDLITAEKNIIERNRIFGPKGV